MTDQALAELHAQGSAAYAVPEAWAVIDEEFKNRGRNGIQAESDLQVQKEAEHAIARLATVWYLRLVAAAVDTGVMFVLALVTIAVSTAVLGDSPAFASTLLLTLIVLGYMPLCELAFHTTLGKRLVGARLAALDGGSPTGRQIGIRAIFRTFYAYNLVARVMCGAGWFHDRFSGTLVVSRVRPPDVPSEPAA